MLLLLQAAQSLLFAELSFKENKSYPTADICHIESYEKNTRIR